MLIHRLIESEDVRLYRAVEQNGLTKGEPYTVHVRDDRKPRDSVVPFVMMFEYGIEKSLGVRNIRRRALFAGTDLGITNGYGNAILELEPPANAPVVYNPEIRDSVVRTAPESPAEPVVEEVMEYFGKLAQLSSEHFKMDYLPAYRSMMKILSSLSWYFSPGDHLQKFEQRLKTIIVWEEGATELIEIGKDLFTRASEWMASGYVNSTVADLKPGSYEVMLYDIETCDAVVLRA